MSKKLISPSEVDSFQQCKRKHYYAHRERLQPKSFSTGLVTGTTGHAILQRYYTMVYNEEILDPVSGMQRAFHIETQESVSPQNIESFGILKPILEQYATCYGTDPQYKILALEKSFETEDGIAFTPDLVLQDSKTGKVYIVDHKFLANFYPDRIVPLFPQMLRYMGLLRELGFTVDGYMYNEIRTKAKVNATHNDLFRRVVFTPKQVTVQQAMLEMRASIDEIRRQDYIITRSPNFFNCGSFCSFASLCTADLQDQPGRELLVRTFYEPNTYVYYKDEVDE